MDFEKLLDQFALLLSRIFHPFIISIPAGLLLLYLADLSLLESLKWICISAVMTILPTALFMKFHPNYYLRDINSRENRNLLYNIGIIELVSLTILVWFLEAPDIIIILGSSSVILALIGDLINHFTKVSFHVGIVSSFSTAISFLSPIIGLTGFVITLGVAWSRLRLKRHTYLQVALGLAIPVICITLVFQMFL